MELQKFIFGRIKITYLLFALFVCLGTIALYTLDQSLASSLEAELAKIRASRLILAEIDYLRYQETESTIQAYSAAAASSQEQWEQAEIIKYEYQRKIKERSKSIERTLPQILAEIKRSRSEREYSFGYLLKLRQAILEISYIEDFVFEQIDLKDKKSATAALFGEHYRTLKLKILDALNDWHNLETQQIIENENTAQEILWTQNIIRIVYASFFIAALFIFISLIERTTSSVKKIQKATERLKSGDFDTTIKLDTADELQEIADNFNEVTKTLLTLEEEHSRIETAKTRFLSITSHELRSPMTPMKAQLQMLEKGYFGTLNGKQLQSVKTVVRNAEHLDKIIADFLEISRIEAGRLKFSFQKISISTIIDNVSNLMKNFIPDKKIKIIKTIQKIPPIEADADRISQVLRNLLSNAIKFSPKNSKIEINALHAGNHICISVKDYGQGIPFEEQNKIFQPFYQAGKGLEREFGGTGLGLAISRGIITAQNGRIWFESQPKKGTTFYFTIPLKPVREIKPIQVVFASNDDTEKQISDTFKEMLGTMGLVEFDRLKSEGLDPTTIYSYIDQLQQDNIIERQERVAFKRKIENIFKPTEQPLHQIIKALKR